MRRAIRSLVPVPALVFVAALTALAVPAVAGAATIDVAQTADIVANDGTCSLREAVQAANTNSAAGGCAAGEATLDTIKLPTGTYSRGLLETSGDPDDNSGGDLDVDLSGGPVEIAGSGRVPTEIRGATSGNARSRIMDVHGTGSISFHDVSLANTTLLDGPGAGLRTDGANVTMDRVRVFNNWAQSNNAVTGGLMGGGGIAAFGGSLTIHDALLSGDQVSHFGAFNDNGAAAGGAILLANGASADIDSVWLYQNTVFSNNPAMKAGGGGIAIIGAAGDVSIRNSTIESNDVTSPSGTVIGGAGIYWDDNTGANNTLKLDNDTILLNDTAPVGAAGGGILADDGTIRAANLTLWANGLLNDPNVGPQIRFTKGDGTFTIRSSAISAAGKEGECAGDPLTSAGYNVEQGPVDDCNFAGPGSTLEDPQLSGATLNEGLTRTIIPGNPSLFDRIPPASCLDSGGSAAQSRDQRGVLRNTGNCDVGAVEMGCDGKAATVIGTSGPDVLNGGANDDVIVGLAGADTIDGAGGNDSICGGAGADILTGGAGDDFIQPYIGPDTVDGGADNDTISLQDITNSPSLNVNLAAGTSSVTASMTGIENAIGGNGGTNQRLIGDGGPNVLDGSGAAEDGSVEGGAGDDTLIGGGPEKLRSTAVYTNALNAVTANLTTGQATGDGTDTLIGITSITGSGFDDMLTGDSGNNRLTGGGGVDTVSYADIPVNPVHTGITGGVGNSITGFGAGTDALVTVENLTGSPNDDTITGTSSNNILDGGNGVDTLNYEGSGAGAMTIDLAAHSSTGNGTDTIDNFENVIGANNADTITGDSGDNVLEGAGGNDTITGGGGTDSVGFTTAPGTVNVNLAAQTATGDGTDTLVDIDNVVGSGFDDTITGSPADNIIDGRGGVDFVSYLTATQPVTVDLRNGTATGDGADTLLNMENVTGSPNADTLIGNDAVNQLDGGDGDDTLDGGLAKDGLEGGAGSDTVSFASHADPVSVDLATGSVLGQGNDTILNVENITGSTGDDTLKGDGGDNAIDGEGGTDTLSYADATDGVLVDLVAGTASGQGNDSLARIENLRGSLNDDTFAGTPADNILDGNGGSDTADYSAASSLNASLVADTATGAGAGNDQVPAIENIIGSAGDDIIVGDSKVNRLDGGAGNDQIGAGGGVDAVLGGAGADVLRIRDSAADTADCGADTDADTVTSDARDLDVLINCNTAADTLEYLGEPPVKGAAGEQTKPAPTPATPQPAPPRKCKKGKKLKKGKCVKKKKKAKKHRQR